MKTQVNTARTINPGMSPFQRFQVGDHVAHVTLGDGVVTKNDGRLVEVRYEKAYGQYDRIWFEQNSRMLFHRGTEPTVEAPYPMRNLMPRPEVEWRDLTPPGCAYEVHGAPLSDGVEYRHRMKTRGLGSEPRSSFMLGEPWRDGLPEGIADPMAVSE